MKYLFLFIVAIFSNKIYSQITLNDYLDSIAKSNNVKWINIEDSIKNKPKTINNDSNLKTKIILTRQDSLKQNALDKFNYLKSKNNEPIICLYVPKFDKVGNLPDIKKRMEQGFPAGISLHYSTYGFYLAAETDVLIHYSWALAGYIYNFKVKSNTFNLANQFICGSVGGMFSLEKTDKKRIGPGLFWGGFHHNNGYIQQIFGGVICSQNMTKNFLPIRCQLRYGAGIVDVHREKTKLLGTYWELSSHIPITFTKYENDVNFYISPYALYSNIPYYDDNYKYLFTPSTFMIGLKFGIGIRNN